MYNRPQGPQNFGGVFDHAFRLFRASFRHVYLLMLAGALINQFAAEATGQWGTADPAQLEFGAGTIALFILNLLITFIIFGAVIFRMQAVIEEKTMSMGSAVTVGIRRLIPVIVVTLLYVIAVLVGLVLLIVPGIIVSVSLILAFYPVVLRGMGPWQSLKYSHSLVWGRWWRTVAMITVLAFVTGAFYLLLGFATGAALFMTGDLPWYLNFVVLPLAGAVLNLLFYAMFLAIFDDLDLRHQGGDLASRVDALTDS